MALESTINFVEGLLLCIRSSALYIIMLKWAASYNYRGRTVARLYIFIRYNVVLGSTMESRTTSTRRFSSTWSTKVPLWSPTSKFRPPKDLWIRINENSCMCPGRLKQQSLFLVSLSRMLYSYNNINLYIHIISYHWSIGMQARRKQGSLYW